MSLDPSIIERYAKLMELKAGSRVARFTLLGLLFGGLVGGSPLLAGKIHLIHSAIPAQYGFGLAIAGAAGGAYLGYLVGQSRAVALRLQAHVAVHQLEVERLIRRLDGLRLPLPEPDVAVLASAPVEPLPAAAPAPVAVAAPAPPEPPAAPVQPPAPMPAPAAAPAPLPAPVHSFSFPQTVPVSSPPTSSSAPVHPAPAPMPTVEPMPPVVPATEPAPFPASVQAFPAPTSFFVPVSEAAPSPVTVSAPTPVPAPAPPQLVPEPEPEPEQQLDQVLDPPARLAPTPPAPFEWATPPTNAVRTNP